MKKVSFELPVYTFQVDFAGHVSNIVYIQWMEIGRNKLLEAAGYPVRRLIKAGLVPVLARTEITYRKPLFLGDRVRVEAWLSRLQGATAHIQIRFYNDRGDLVASGSHRGLFIDSLTGRPRRLGVKMKAALEHYVFE